MHPSALGIDQLDTQLDIQAWMQKSQPLGPCCEWPRWQGGDPADRWPAASDWPLNR
ncbi:MAG: hypothetical protein HC857_05555 [Synechococcales cyanobacterium RU_4_20]|nr:hypothetical protein [Synechococcales cyanobacterium RU_4_20]